MRIGRGLTGSTRGRDSKRRPLAVQKRSSPAPPPLQPFGVNHYFKFREGVDADLLEADLRRFMDDNRYMGSESFKMRYIFRKLTDVHLRSPNPFDGGSNNVQRLWLYAAIGVLVLLISGCNFVMLATLRSVDRMREIGIRKTVGGEGGQLLRQYLVDAFAHTLLAALLAIFLLQLALPRMQVALGLPLQIDLWTWESFGLCLAIVAGFTLVSGAYPALLMSKGKPAELLSNSSGVVLASGNGLRRTLVGIQFAIVIMLLLASAVVQQQIRYMQNRDRGFSLDNVVALRMPSFELTLKAAALVTEFARLPGVQAAAAGSVAPGTITIGQPPPVRRTAADGEVIEAAIQGASVGSEYFRALSVPVLAGREFSVAIDGQPPAQGDAPPSIRDVMLNLSAAQDLGFSAPEMAIEQLLETESRNQQGELTRQAGRVIGVVADTQFSSVLLPPVPQIYYFSAQAGFVAVKLQPEADVAAVTSALKAVWDSVIGTGAFSPLSPELMDGNLLRREEFEARIIIGSTMLAMVIALLGLYGLVAATVVKREKEIGVRKVMGADRKSIVALLLWQFSKPVLVANLIAWPLGFWGVRQWLQRFPYQLDTTQIVWAGLTASVVALLIAWLTVGFMAAKAASAKPVLALRNE